jgi:hypothetical protein
VRCARAFAWLNGPLELFDALLMGSRTLWPALAALLAAWTAAVLARWRIARYFGLAGTILGVIGALSAAVFLLTLYHRPGLLLFDGDRWSEEMLSGVRGAWTYPWTRSMLVSVFAFFGGLLTSAVARREDRKMRECGVAPVKPDTV